MLAIALPAVLLAALPDDELKRRIAQVLAQSQGGGMLPGQTLSFTAACRSVHHRGYWCGASDTTQCSQPS